MKTTIVLFMLFTILHEKILATENETSCLLSMSTPLSHGNHRYINNASLVTYEELLIPMEYQWYDGNITYGCICNISTTPCIRKCCEENELLTHSLRPTCIKVNETLPGIKLNSHNLDDELKNMSDISNYFQIIHNKICPGVTFRLLPEQFAEDNDFILYSNGSLFAGELLPQWRYCIDWEESMESIFVLVCHLPEPDAVTAIVTTVYPIGIIVSIPFLIATIIVYAIIPELQNLYGRTLMCYVGCLIAAYIFLASERFVHHKHALCEVLGIMVFLYILFYLEQFQVTGNYSTPTELYFELINSSLDYRIEIENDLKAIKWQYSSNQVNFTTVPNIIPICCPPGDIYYSSKCQKNATMTVDKLELPLIYNENLHLSKKNPDSFQRKEGIPCEHGSYALNSESPDFDVFYLLENGTIYENNSLLGYADEWLNIEDYCLASIINENNELKSVVAVCLPPNNDEELRNIRIMYPIAMAMSTPFLAVTFLIYAFLPELKNIHGMTLMAYVASLFMAYVVLMVVQFGNQTIINITNLCITLAFVIHFSFLSSFFWLNVMCFDIWWTFGGFRGLQGTAKQRERKKFIIYSIYAWGCASFFTGVCLIMDFVPQIPSYFIRPQFGESSCWFMTDAAKAIYFYAPMGVTIVCNIILFISTALKIIRHKKETTHHLKGIDSRRHDDNKQWFNLYLKLFIVMGINWSMEIISWLFKDAPECVWYISDLANTLQGVIIFIIFVWKDKIKRLLLKRLGIKAPTTTQSRQSTRSGGFNSSNSTSKILVPLREQNSLHHNYRPEQNHCTTTITDDSDCV